MSAQVAELMLCCSRVRYWIVGRQSKRAWLNADRGTGVAVSLLSKHSKTTLTSLELPRKLHRPKGMWFPSCRVVHSLVLLVEHLPKIILVVNG